MKKEVQTGCTVRVSHTFEELSAQVTLDDGLEVGPGDRVLVHGAPVNPPYGEVWVERRVATLTRASRLGQLWVRLTGDLECLELLDVSFTDRRIL